LRNVRHDRDATAGHRLYRRKCLRCLPRGRREGLRAGVCSDRTRLWCFLHRRLRQPGPDRQCSGEWEPGIATPYIFAGLAVALGFQGGLFNIGAEGQYFIAGLLTVFVGYSITGLPQVIHLPLALLAGMAGGALWAAIPGYLKGKTGAHEVINTIMMNYIAFRLAEFLLDVQSARRFSRRPICRSFSPTAWRCASMWGSCWRLWLRG